MSTAAAYHLQATEMMFSCGMMLFGITPKGKKQRETTYRITLINMEVYTTPDYATKPKKPWIVLLRSTWLALSQCHLLNLYATMNNSSTKACHANTCVSATREILELLLSREAPNIAMTSFLVLSLPSVQETSQKFSSLFSLRYYHQ